MNYLCYDRVAASEYEAWGEMGSDGWTWDAFFEAMTKSENFTGSDRHSRGRSGPIRNTYNRIIYNVLTHGKRQAENSVFPLTTKATWATIQ